MCEAESNFNYQEAIRCLAGGDDVRALHFVKEACYYHNHEQNVRLKAFIRLKNLYNGKEEKKDGQTV